MSYRILSGSVQGKAIKVTASGSPGVDVHQGVVGTTDIDQVWVYVENRDTSDRVCTLEWGGTAADDRIEVTVEAGAGLKLVAPGIPIQNELVVKCFGSAPNVLYAFGYVHRIDS